MNLETYLDILKDNVFLLLLLWSHTDCHISHGVSYLSDEVTIFKISKLFFFFQSKTPAFSEKIKSSPGHNIKKNTLTTNPLHLATKSISDLWPQGGPERDAVQWGAAREGSVDAVWERGWETGDRCDQKPACHPWARGSIRSAPRGEWSTHQRPRAVLKIQQSLLCTSQDSWVHHFLVLEE